ncbi:hypothetical protein P280DRAFT_51242 [Massarina eburnea CBS 473.64]|uniref:Uncharacterized protein n=1 Tax=Massarina eburnea CBS 473.64 TaxID=1395130 RepID=A0A6A6RWY7_9PLEO|nr:hypothetical protein P280DRAFT_51242 [Massarina eburnea CBS 473.64]
MSELALYRLRFLAKFFFGDVNCCVPGFGSKHGGGWAEDRPARCTTSRGQSTRCIEETQLASIYLHPRSGRYRDQVTAVACICIRAEVLTYGCRVSTRQDSDNKERINRLQLAESSHSREYSLPVEAVLRSEIPVAELQADLMRTCLRASGSAASSWQGTYYCDAARPRQ